MDRTSSPNNKSKNLESLRAFRQELDSPEFQAQLARETHGSVMSAALFVTQDMPIVGSIVSGIARQTAPGHYHAYRTLSSGGGGTSEPQRVATPATPETPSQEAHQERLLMAFHP